jgi:hypothetical protein
LLIFLSAYAPLVVIVVAKDFDFDQLEFGHPRAGWISLVLGLLAVAVLYAAMTTLHGQYPIQVKTVKGRAGDLINYSIPYLAAFVTVDKFFELPNVVAFALFMALLFVLTWKTQSLFINPILAVMGYSLYDVQFQEGTTDRDGVFLIKGELWPEERVRILRLSQFLYLATKEEQTNEAR